MPQWDCLYPADILLPSKRWIENHFKVSYWGTAKNGGHFLSVDDPHSYADGLFLFFSKLE